MPLDDNDDDNDNVGDVDDDDDDDDEDHSLATPEMNYRWDTNDCDLEHSHFALDGVKRARDRSLSIVLFRYQRRVARDRSSIIRVFAILGPIIRW